MTIKKLGPSHKNNQRKIQNGRLGSPFKKDHENNYKLGGWDQSIQIIMKIIDNWGHTIKTATKITNN